MEFLGGMGDIETKIVAQGLVSKVPYDLTSFDHVLVQMKNT